MSAYSAAMGHYERTLKRVRAYRRTGLGHWVEMPPHFDRRDHEARCTVCGVSVWINPMEDVRPDLLWCACDQRAADERAWRAYFGVLTEAWTCPTGG